MSAPSSQQFVEEQPKGVDVGRSRDAGAGHLLGACVLRRHRLDTGAGDDRSGVVVGEQLGDAEVEQLDRAAIADQDVRGLEVAMDDEVAMRGVHGLADGRDQVEAGGEAQPMCGAVAIDGLAGDMLHDHERHPVVGRSGIEELGDVGMDEAGEHAAFLLEAARGVAPGHCAGTTLSATSRSNAPSARRAR